MMIREKNDFENFTQKLHDSSRKKNIKIWPIRCHADLFYKFTRKRMILAVKMSKAYVTFVTATPFLVHFSLFSILLRAKNEGVINLLFRLRDGIFCFVRRPGISTGTGSNRDLIR